MKLDSVNRIKAEEAVELLIVARDRMLNEEGLFEVYNKIFNDNRQSFTSKKEPRPTSTASNDAFDNWPTLPSTRKNSEVSIMSRAMDEPERFGPRQVCRSDSDAESRITEIVMIPDSPNASPDPLNLPDTAAILADYSRTPERTPFNWQNPDGTNPTYVGLSREEPSAFRRVYDYTSTNYIKMVERTAAVAERVTTQSATAFGALRSRVRVPNIRIPGPSILDNQYYSNLRKGFFLKVPNWDFKFFACRCKCEKPIKS